MYNAPIFIYILHRFLLYVACKKWREKKSKLKDCYLSANCIQCVMRDSTTLHNTTHCVIAYTTQYDALRDSTTVAPTQYDALRDSVTPHNTTHCVIARQYTIRRSAR